MITNEVQVLIQKEFRRAEAADAAGNHGMVRVCARRAAGIAIAHWLGSHPRPAWGTDAITRLRAIVSADDIPHAVQDAARRLASRINADFSPSFTTNPMNDATTIIEFFVR